MNEPTERPAVVLLSGGLDSATAAAIARQQGFAVYALSVDYGQRHRFELEAARRVGRRLGVREHTVLTVDPRVEAAPKSSRGFHFGRPSQTLITSAA